MRCEQDDYETAVNDIYDSQVVRDILDEQAELLLTDSTRADLVEIIGALCYTIRGLEEALGADQ